MPGLGWKPGFRTETISSGLQTHHLPGEGTGRVLDRASSSCDILGFSLHNISCLSCWDASPERSLNWPHSPLSTGIFRKGLKKCPHSLFRNDMLVNSGEFYSKEALFCSAHPLLVTCLPEPLVRTANPESKNTVSQACPWTGGVGQPRGWLTPPSSFPLSLHLLISEIVTEFLPKCMSCTLGQ